MLWQQSLFQTLDYQVPLRLHVPHCGSATLVTFRWQVNHSCTNLDFPTVELSRPCSVPTAFLRQCHHSWYICTNNNAFSAWHSWLGVSYSIWSVKNWVMRCCLGYLSEARFIAYSPADATATSLSLASLKSRLILPFWYWLTQVFLARRPLNGCLPCTNHHHIRFKALFPALPGWASARRELLDSTVQGKINRGRHTDHPAGCHSNRTN